jgi:transposase
MQSEDRKGRRRYSAQLKAQAMAECEAPGASVARVAMAQRQRRAPLATVGAGRRRAADAVVDGARGSR